MSRVVVRKQFLLPLSDCTMLQDTVLRLSCIDGGVTPASVSNSEHRFLVAEQLREIDVNPHKQAANSRFSPIGMQVDSSSTPKIHVLSPHRLENLGRVPLPLIEAQSVSSHPEG